MEVLSEPATKDLIYWHQDGSNAPVARGKSALRGVWNSGQALCLGDPKKAGAAYEDPRFNPAADNFGFEDPHHVVSIMYVPLVLPMTIGRECRLGILAMVNKHPGGKDVKGASHFTMRQDVARVRTLCAMASLALQNAQRYEETAFNEERRRSMLSMIQQLTRQERLEPLLRLSVECVESLVKSDSVAIYLLESEDEVKEGKRRLLEDPDRIGEETVKKSKGKGGKQLKLAMVSGAHVFHHVEHLAPGHGIEWETMQSQCAQTQILSAIVGRNFQQDSTSGEEGDPGGNVPGGNGGGTGGKSLAPKMPSFIRFEEAPRGRAVSRSSTVVSAGGSDNDDDSSGEGGETIQESRSKMINLLPLTKLGVTTALCVPIIRQRQGPGETPIGVMLVLKEAPVHEDGLTAQPHRYTSDDISILQAYCHQLPCVIKAVTWKENQRLVHRAYEASTRNRHGSNTFEASDPEGAARLPTELIKSSLSELLEVL